MTVRQHIVEQANALLSSIGVAATEGAAAPGSCIASDDVIGIRHPTPADRGPLLDLRIRSREQLEPWEPRPVDGVSTWGEAWFGRYLAQCRTDTCQRFLLIRRQDDAIVGQVSLNQIFRGPFGNAIMGYWIGTGHTRRGYASRGIRLVLACAFTGLGLHRVEANIVPTNTASLALARRVGFRLEGYSPRYLQINGAWADHTRWAMTAEDWAAITPANTSVTSVSSVASDSPEPRRSST